MKTLILINKFTSFIWFVLLAKLVWEVIPFMKLGDWKLASVGSMLMLMVAYIFFLERGVAKLHKNNGE